MRKALIGYTGFVGSNLAAQTDFTNLYNSKNIQDIDGKSYDLVVCAGARAEKWRINQEPEKDLTEIDGLIGHLKKVTTKKFVLVSTTDVYKNPNDVDEDTPIETDGLHAYGTNRYHLEQFCRQQFDALIIRLPGLFGPGLKKNVIYDFMHDNNVERIHHAGSFQYYNLARIWSDIQTALDNSLELVNFATEPVMTDEIAEYCFGIKDFTQEPEGVRAGSYNMTSKYADVFGGSKGYFSNKQQVLNDIREFISKEKTA